MTGMQGCDRKTLLEIDKMMQILSQLGRGAVCGTQPGFYFKIRLKCDRTKHSTVLYTMSRLLQVGGPEILLEEASARRR